jgi:hypothetical protein
LTGVSRNSPISANATIWSNFRRTSRRDMPRMEPLRKTFSRPVNSGWNPVPTSSKLPIRPRSRTSPEVGRVIRLRIFSRVDFPAPLGPTTPSTSPGSTRNETPFSAQNSPGLTASARPRRRNIRPTRRPTVSAPSVSDSRSVRYRYRPCRDVPIWNRFERSLTQMTALMWSGGFR